jgi:hypothetical protein
MTRLGRRPLHHAALRISSERSPEASSERSIIVQRNLAAIAIVVASFLAGTPAEAFHGRHCRWGGGWGSCGPAWGGCGYGGCWWPAPCYGGVCTAGFRGYGYPGYGLGCLPGCYSYSIPYTAPIAVPLATVASPVIALPAGGAAAPVVASAAPRGAATIDELRRLLGLSDPRPGAPAALPAASTRVAPPAAAKPHDDVLARHSNIESRRKAERLLAEGDELFRAQSFHAALQKYKLAARTAPELAEAHWRQGHALVATRNFDLAARSFERAVALTDDLGRGGFQLNDLYGAAARTKANHLDALAEWALSRDAAPQPYFLVGLFLHYDGQPGRAEKYFRKASDLAGISGAHLAVFLAKPAETPERSPTPSRPSAATPLVPVSAGTEI